MIDTFKNRINSLNSGSRFNTRKAVNLNPKMGETHIIGGFHSGFLADKNSKPYAKIAHGAVLSDRIETNS